MRMVGRWKKNMSKSVELWSRSASLGQVNAMFKLGQCYMKGKGVEMNIEKAVELYRKAASAGNSHAEIKLKELGREESTI